jgi:DNA gyrase inhibitor GyrI
MADEVEIKVLPETRVAYMRFIGRCLPDRQVLAIAQARPLST